VRITKQRWQISLLGLLGIGLAWEEGVEVNLLGLSTGIDFNDLALRLPGIGRVEALPSPQGREQHQTTPD
jgi:hypothetical protein